ncbi:hypothetical protein LTR70_006644 [Exophiala xenobiotica]|uniref:Uncharacterized protein n=1 Tax=Lithohypha guttulata TaxID=1690604 RepID=A0ABR0KNK7_9EURO|nr:hypothetical protein LTR24_000358 [Lithohypha guttulata]KAK5315653.1 hypothetical protein LTR70_006644 [Exophiala xenobiotica]
MSDRDPQRPNADIPPISNKPGHYFRRSQRAASEELAEHLNDPLNKVEFGGQLYGHNVYSSNRQGRLGSNFNRPRARSGGTIPVHADAPPPSGAAVAGVHSDDGGGAADGNDAAGCADSQSGGRSIDGGETTGPGDENENEDENGEDHIDGDGAAGVAGDAGDAGDTAGGNDAGDEDKSDSDSDSVLVIVEGDSDSEESSDSDHDEKRDDDEETAVRSDDGDAVAGAEAQDLNEQHTDRTESDNNTTSATVANTTHTVAAPLTARQQASLEQLAERVDRWPVIFTLAELVAILRRNKWYITAAEKEAWRLMDDMAQRDEDEAGNTGTIPEEDGIAEGENVQAHGNTVEEGRVGRHGGDDAAMTASNSDFNDNSHEFNDHGTTAAQGSDQEGITNNQAGGHGIGNQTDFGPPIGDGQDLTPSEMQEIDNRIAQIVIIESASPDTDADSGREVDDDAKDNNGEADDAAASLTDLEHELNSSGPSLNTQKDVRQEQADGDEDDGSGHRLGGSQNNETSSEITAEDLRRRRIVYPRGPERGMNRSRHVITRMNEQHEAEPPSTPTQSYLRPVSSEVPKSRNHDAAVTSLDDNSQCANGQSD